MSLGTMWRVSVVAVAVCCMTSGGWTQTGPAPQAEKARVAESPTVKPRRFIDPEAAAAIWRMHPKAGETTAAATARAGKRLKGLLTQDPAKLEYDIDYWQLLAYMREVPWTSMPRSRQRWYLEHMPNPRLTDEQRAAILANVNAKPLYKITPKELDVYLGWLKQAVPDLRQRVVTLARKNVGEPYQMYLLGEFPHEIYDADPTYNLGKGDCVVFSEHMYSMALSSNWNEFYRTLQRLRYKDGVVGMTTRNHYTEADWDKNNSWLVRDVTHELGATTVTKYREPIDRAKFFANFGIGQGIPKQVLEDDYIPAAAVPSVLAKLQDGDFVNVVRGVGEGVWVGHVGLIAHGKDGTVHFIHSTPPKSKEQPIMEYVTDNVKKNVERAKKGKAQFLGFKFLRLRAEDLKDGAPKQTASTAGQPAPDFASSTQP